MCEVHLLLCRTWAESAADPRFVSATMDSSATPAVFTPDWNTIDEEILCPLCDYNLRGLTEPRCPECGYACDWPELLDSNRRRHSYLFEHHPERNVVSFWQTAVGGLRPSRFWSALHPAQPSVARRLLLYWLCCTSFFLVALAGGMLSVAYDRARRQVAVNAARGLGNAPRRIRMTRDMINRLGTRLWYLNAQRATRLTPALVWDTAVARGRVRDYFVLGSIVLIWPWLTVAALMIFRMSMRKARIRTIHVLRCVLYGYDLVVWLGLALVVTTLLTVLLQDESWLSGLDLFSLRRINSAMIRKTSWLGGERLFAAGCLALWLFAAFRVSVAYQLYLRFDHPTATVFAAQGIVALLVGNLLIFVLL